MLRFHGTLTASILAVLAACGGRSSLTGATIDASGGSGGAMSSTSSTTSSTSTISISSSTSGSSSSGAGAAPPFCTGLTLSGHPITPDPSFEHGRLPLLVPATEDGSRVSMVFGKQAPEGPAIPPVRAANVTFAPWADWPVGLGPDSQVLSFGGDAVAVAPAFPSSQPGFATLFYIPTGAFPSDMALAPSTAPDTHYDPFPPQVQWDGWEPAWAVSLARGDNRHLAAYEVGMGPNTHLTVAQINPAGASVIPDVACANTPFPAAVAPTQGGFLIATASGRDFGACQFDEGIPGPPLEVQVSRLDEATSQLTLSALFQEPDPVSHIALAQGENAWLVWQNNGASAFAPPAIRATRLDAAGSQVGPIFNVTSSGATTGPFAAAALGPFLAVAWVDALDPSTPNLRVDIFDANGTFIAGASQNTAPNWLYDNSLSLLASPDGQKLLLAWSDIDATPSSLSAPRVARFSCVTPL